MATVTNKLSPAQVAIACALYQREIDLGKKMPVPEKEVLLGTFNSHTMKGDLPTPDAFDYIILTYEV
jgi:hypothetical protein